MHPYDKKVLTIYLKKVLIACGQSCKIIFTWSLKFTILIISTWIIFNKEFQFDFMFIHCRTIIHVNSYVNEDINLN